jgi:hypothetical protein
MRAGDVKQNRISTDNYFLNRFPLPLPALVTVIKVDAVMLHFSQNSPSTDVRFLHCIERNQ